MFGYLSLKDALAFAHSNSSSRGIISLATLRTICHLSLGCGPTHFFLFVCVICLPFCLFYLFGLFVFVLKTKLKNCYVVN
jgi:hypothetical protein